MRCVRVCVCVCGILTPSCSPQFKICSLNDDQFKSSVYLNLDSDPDNDDLDDHSDLCAQPLRRLFGCSEEEVRHIVRFLWLCVHRSTHRVDALAAADTDEVTCSSCHAIHGHWW